MSAHDCETQLAKDTAANILLAPAHATEGDLWTCSCGREYEHYCCEAEGCGWQEIKEEQP